MGELSTSGGDHDRRDPLTQPYGAEDSSRFSRLNARGKRATLRGDYEEALRTYDAALRLARELAEDRMIIVARLNRAMVMIKMGEARRGEEGLREILLQTSDRRIAFSAAYNLASSLRKQGSYEQALRYARRAMDRSRELAADDLRAAVHNLLGNILLGQSYLDDALHEYEQALALRRSLPGDQRFSLAILEENVGYCQLLQRRFEEGMVRIRAALELARQVGDRRCRAECLQDLCFGHLMLDRFSQALEYGEQALDLAVETGYDDVEENCHYLLGELGSRAGDLDRRDRHFERLQEQHPELPFLKDFLCSVDVTNIITLKR